MPDSTVGVDISKTRLDVHVVPAGKARAVPQRRGGIRGAARVDRVAGSLRHVRADRTVAPRLRGSAARGRVAAGACQPGRFAQAIGQRARTDAVDARVLAQMGAALDLRLTEASSAARRALEELQVARDALVKDRTAALNRQKQVRHRLLKQQNKNRLAQLDRHLAAIDTEIGKRLAEDERLARRTEILTSIPGVSRVTAAGLLTQMPEFGGLDAKAVASLAGLAPVTRQSGAWQGRSFIHGGRAGARRLLYMPALAAICYNPDLRAKYGQLVAQGKPRKVAVVAVMRKLLVLANVLLGEDRCWLPERPGWGSANSAGSAPLVTA